jgi:SAM-dependent methyltransferase
MLHRVRTFVDDFDGLPKTRMRKKTVETLYDKISVKYHTNRPLAISDYTELPAVISLAGEVRGRQVLDIGCGPGRHAKRLLAKGAHVTGIDISEEMINIAREHCGGRGRFFQADFEQAEFGPASFDLIIASLTLMYSREINPVINKLGGWLRPKGRFIFSLYHPVRFFHKIPDFDFSKSRKVWIHLEGCDVTVFNYYHPMEKYFDALRQNGFEMVKFKEPVLSRRYKGWPEDHYKVPRSLVIEAQKRFS